MKLPSTGPLSALYSNWISLAGLVISLGSIFSFLLLFILDNVMGSSNAYVGILAYIVAPAFFLTGCFFIILGWGISRYFRKKGKTSFSPYITVDLSRPADRNKLILFVGGTLLFIFLSALGSYQTYHYTESVEFCGQTCHSVMKPEYTTYQNSPHARVACAECHIGSGAEWKVKSKINGAYQVYATLVENYPRPIPTPIENLRPAQETCEQCHWPERFSGNLDRTYQYSLSDEENTPFYVRMSLKVGGANPRQGTVEGIHWHMSPDVKVEYIATDEERQEIPWVRVTHLDGEVEVYQSEEFAGTPEDYHIRVMDCIDCHNRPAHIYRPPTDLVDESLALGRISRELPDVRAKLVALLAEDSYETEAGALESLSAELTEAYGDHPAFPGLVEETQTLFQRNFFPEMKARWDAYPDNIGHMNWLGCFRCHDEEHLSSSTGKAIPASDCSSCHTILAQGDPGDMDALSMAGAEFDHPGGSTFGLACSDCHTGGPLEE